MSFNFNTHPFTSKLTNVKQRGANRWECSCPCTQNHKHGDKTQSLSVSYDPTTDNILVKCHTGCNTEDIVTAVGCTMSDLFGHGRDSSLINSISWYANKNGYRFSGVIYQYGDGYLKVKFYKPDGEKTFAWIHTDSSQKSGYKWGRGAGFTPRLYVAGNLKDDNPLVIVVEGEKDAETVYRLTGITAVSADDGATKGTKAGKKWASEYTEQLTNKIVYILYDNDDAGRDFAQIEANNLVGKATSVKMMDILTVWPDCPEGGDITDLADTFGDEETKKKFDQLFDTATPAIIAESINGITVRQAVETKKPDTAERKPEGNQKTEEIPPLETFDADFFNNTDIPDPVPIIDRILYPGFGLLGSPAKMGKSYMMLQLAIAVATGESFLGFNVKRPGAVLYLDLQGTKARTKKRLKSMGYTLMPKGVTLVYRARNTDNGFLQQIEQWITAADNPSLVIIDMMEQIKGSQRRTEDAYRADNRILEPLHDIALKHDISVFGVTHTRKGNSIVKPDDPFNEIIGSVAQFGSADCAWMILGKRNEDIKQLSIICRDNDDGQEDFEAIFKNHRWTVSGTIAEIEEQKAIDQYENNPVVFTIRKLVQESGGGWFGTMNDLIQEVATRTGEYPATSPRKMSILVNGIAYRLSCEGIEIEYPNKNGGASGRRYKFSRKAPKQLQQNI